MKKYKVLQYDRFFQPGYDLYNVWYFETLEAAEKFMANCEESKRKWPRIYGNNEYILEEVQMKLEKDKVEIYEHGRRLRKKKNNDLITVDYVELSTKGGKFVYKVYDIWGNAYDADELYSTC